MPSKKASAEWDKTHTTFVGLKLNNRTDADILAWFAQQPSKQGAIKEAIRAAINKQAT